MPFSNRVCVVTGGTGALGSAVVRDLLELNAEVHLTWREARELQRADFKKHVVLHEADLGDESSVAAVYEKAGPVYASIHVAGGFAMGPVPDISQADFEGMLRLNAATAFLCCREAVRLDPSGGAHANLGSALQVMGDLPAAQACLREAVRLQPDDAVAPLTMRTNCIAPGNRRRVQLPFLPDE